MQTITLKPLQHRGAECIGIYFENYPSLNTIIRKQATAKWSQTKKCWYIPYTQKHYSLLQNALKEKAILNTDALKKYSEERKKEKQTAASQPAIKSGSGKNLHKQSVTGSPAPRERARPDLSGGLVGAAVNKHVLPCMKQQLVLKAYSPSTIKTYLNEMSIFLKTIKQHPADELTAARLRNYLQYCHETLKLTENTLHSRMNALKFYYEQVLKKEKFFWEIPRPKKHLLVTKVLSEVELGKIFKAVPNLKHKAIIFTAYSAGLRVSEVINLKIKDIDSNRMQLFIERAKGKKDRMVNLSPLLLDILRVYLKKEKQRPVMYLFEGEKPGEPYSIRSAQQIFTSAKAKAGISKAISFHGLRHSFATHLMEKGVDIKYIKEILGHFDIRTTERYLHVARKNLVNITSPLDDLKEKGFL